VKFEAAHNKTRIQEIFASDVLFAFVWQPVVVYLYMCLPRALLVARVPSSEFQLSRGFLDQTLAYIGVILGFYHLVRLIGSPRLRTTLVRALIIWLHIDFLVRCGEAALMYQFDIGYSSLFFYHLQWESVRLALAQYWLFIAPAVIVVAGFDWILRRMLVATPFAWRPASAGLVTAVMLLFAARCAFVLEREKHRAPEDFAVAALAMNWHAYLDERDRFARVTLTPAERTYLRNIGIGSRRLRRTPIEAKPPKQPLNLITIYLEGFQANFTTAGGSPFRGLTPNLDRFAARSLYMSSFYNAVTPTINSLVSSLCGILSQVENDDLDIDRGYTRNLECLSDVLHDAGYHQEFMGGADSGFSGKRLFLKAHHYDEVWGWERWGKNETYTAAGRRNAWGLHDTDLMREIASRLPSLAGQAPFHLTALTVNTHEPGYVAPDCPEYAQNRLMLNAIHCTDYAFGLLLDALEHGGYLKNTAIIVMGDHTMFPSPESLEALGPAAASWFGKVFMSVYWPAGPRSGHLDGSGYTPDFAPIALDVLGFRPLPRFAFGRSPISRPDPRRTLVAAHFQILDGVMIPAQQTIDDECTPEMLEHTLLDPASPTISPCGRKKIIDSIEEQLLNDAVPSRTSD
jgi:Sulfatase